MKFARIIDDIAVDVLEQDPSSLFHPDIAGTFEPVPEVVVLRSRRLDGAWLPPAEEATAPEPIIQLAVVDFLRLFTNDELAGFNALKKTCAALAPQDYADAAAGDQMKAALVGFEVFLTFYDALRAGLIELNHPQTITGLQLLVPLGVLTAPRLADVLAARLPE